MTVDRERREALSVMVLILLIIVYVVLLVPFFVTSRMEPLFVDGDPCKPDLLFRPQTDIVCRVARRELECMRDCGCGWCNLTTTAEWDHCLPSTMGPTCAYALGKWIPSWNGTYCLDRYALLEDRCREYHRSVGELIGFLFLGLFILFGIWLRLMEYWKADAEAEAGTGSESEDPFDGAPITAS